MALPSHLSVEECIQSPAIGDFDELIVDHPALLREVMGGLPNRPNGGHTERRAKFLAMREWIMISSAFDIPCYFCKQEEATDEPGNLWIKVIDNWIGEEQLPDGLFPKPNPGPKNAIFYSPPTDPLMRHHLNIWLIQIEMAFQAWWKQSLEGCLAVQLPNGDLPIRDVSDHVLTLPVDLRARAVATNTWPDVGAHTVSGRIFLHRPSEALIAWRQSEQEAKALQLGTSASQTDPVGRRL